VPIVGGPEEVAEELIGLAVDGDVDGVLMCFPHYLDGLRRFGSGVMPILRQSLNIGAVK